MMHIFTQAFILKWLHFFFVCLALLMDVTCSWSKKCMTSNQTGFVGSCTWRSRDDRDSRLNLNEN